MVEARAKPNRGVKICPARRISKVGAKSPMPCAKTPVEIVPIGFWQLRRNWRRSWERDERRRGAPAARAARTQPPRQVPEPRSSATRCAARATRAGPSRTADQAPRQLCPSRARIQTRGLPAPAQRNRPTACRAKARGCRGRSIQGRASPKSPASFARTRTRMSKSQSRHSRRFPSACAASDGRQSIRLPISQNSKVRPKPLRSRREQMPARRGLRETREESKSPLHGPNRKRGSRGRCRARRE